MRRATLRPPRAAAVLLVVAAFLALVSWANAQTDAGTLIVNQARAVIRDEVVIPSNQVTTVVQAVCGVRVLPLPSGDDRPAQSFTLVHGGSATVPFRVVNTGNAPHRFDLHADAAGSDPWAPTAMRVFHDLAQSGRRDPGDPLVEHFALDARQHEAFVLVVDAPESGAGLLDVAVSARCVGSAGETPGPNVEASTSARLRLDDRSAPAVNARVQLDEVPDEPGAPRRARATIEIANLGGADVGPVELTVPIEAAGCLTFDPTAQPPDGVQVDDADVDVLTDDGWMSLSEFQRLRADGLASSADVRALRVVRAALAQGQSMVVRFGLLLDEPACADVAALEGIVRADDDETNAVGHLPIVRRPASRLAHVAEPDDHPYLVVGHSRCFDFELINVGGVDDVYTLSLEHDLPTEQASSLRVALRSRADMPLGTTIALAPGERREFRACVTADEPVDAFELIVHAHSRAGADPVHASVAVSAALHGDGFSVSLTADPTSVVVAGATVRFEAALHNDLPFDLNGVRARFEVVDTSAPDGARESLPFLWHESDDGVTHEPETGIVRWQVVSLPAGAVHRVAFELRARDDLPDDARIDSLASARASELGDRVQSNTVQHTVWSSALLASLRVQPERVYPGERYSLTVHVVNPSTRPVLATLVSSAPPGVMPLSASGSAHDTSPEFHPATDMPSDIPSDDPPDDVADDASWVRMWLPPGGDAEATFVLRAGPDPRDPLLGNVLVSGVSETGIDAGVIDLGYAVRVERGPFARDRGVLVGHVFADASGDGRYVDPSTGLAGVRVVLPDGRQTFTDEVGRFAFRDVPVGWWRVQFDPATLPAPLASSPTRVGPSAHRVLVQGVARLDVPVEPLLGHLQVERSTALSHGPLTVAQHESPLGGMTLRVVELRTTEPLDAIVVRWTDPEGGVREWHVGRLDERASRAFVIPTAASPVDPEVTWHRE